MASNIELTSPKLFARELVAFSDAQLKQYLEDHRLDGGAMFIEVEDPQNLPPSFIQRLRDWAQHTSDTDQSRPVDPNQLTSRLLNISSDKNTWPFDRESSTETSSFMPTEELEKRFYDSLVEDGGRPLYSRDLIDEVGKDPFSHWDMIRPWVDHNVDFEPDPDPNADLHVQGAYDYFVLAFRRGSPTYTEAVEKLLAEYGFTQPFQFHQEPTQQDKLTTWIEYLGYECWLHYRHARRVKRMQPKFDAAWKTLVDANLLRPFETQEYVCDIDSSFQRQIESDQATRAVALAKSAGRAVLTWVYNDINDPRGSRHTSAARLQKMTLAKSRCETAEEALSLIRRRNDLITKFKQSVGSYLSSKREAAKHNLRVRWTLEQVPLIEAELNESSTARTGPKPVRGVKRSLDASHDRSVKKQRRDAGAGAGAGAPGPRSGHSDGSPDQRPKLKRGCDDTADVGPPSKRPKRNGEDLDCTSGRSDDPDYQEVNPTLDRQDDTNARLRPRSKPLKRCGEDLDSQNITRAKSKRNRDDATMDGPPSKRLRRRGEALELESKTRDGINSGSAKDFHEPDTVRTMATLDSKKSEPVSDHPQRRTSTRSTGQPPPTLPQPLRRSARIAARHQSNTVKSRRSTGMAPAPKPASSMDLQDQQSRHPATRARTQSARVSKRHGKPGRENSRGRPTKPPLG
ncbi:hypothetical protein DHEL01_v209259 [Diaporthe helianthi]|uniref:Uncharacterized protein n=1 Tax=Diaporthe helianthi TaxID=158607 RepID=A0A2P5HQ34_DIAHE|nr:hypothetical protein DHEL01_v209259 [Diaporthe helianthi]